MAELQNNRVYFFEDHSVHRIFLAREDGGMDLTTFEEQHALGQLGKLREVICKHQTQTYKVIASGRQRCNWSPSLFSRRPNAPSVRTLAVLPQVRCDVVVSRLNVILWSVAISIEFLSHCSS